MNDMVANLEKMLTAGQDGAMLRFGLGNAYLKAKDFEQARHHLARATELDPGFSAAWKALGKAQEGSGMAGEAAATYARGIAVAEEKGDLQAAKEMRVFLKRLERGASS